MKKIVSKKGFESHSANKKFGMGDFYGTGKRAPLAKYKISHMQNNSYASKGNNPPKALA